MLRPAMLAVLALWAAAVPVSAQTAANCDQEAASIRRAQTELPRLEVAPPGDQQIVCITLETNIAFARKLAAHLAHCPRSPLAPDGKAWQRTQSIYLGQFAERRCKPTIKGYRG